MIPSAPHSGFSDLRSRVTRTRGPPSISIRYRSDGASDEPSVPEVPNTTAFESTENEKPRMFPDAALKLLRALMSYTNSRRPCTRPSDFESGEKRSSPMNSERPTTRALRLRSASRSITCSVSPGAIHATQRPSGDTVGERPRPSRCGLEPSSSATWTRKSRSAVCFTYTSVAWAGAASSSVIVAPSRVVIVRLANVVPPSSPRRPRCRTRRS